MLEQTTWMLQPWIFAAKADDGPAHVAQIRDTAGKPLGFVRLGSDAHSSWLTWLGRVRLDVFETDDASHLMTLHRTWGILGSWDLEDADQRHVGTIYSKTLVTANNDRLGYIDRNTGRVFDPAGKILASASKGPAGLQIHVAREMSNNPFVRMLVFGSALTMMAMPKSG